jgi:hypothetical protein
MRTIKRFTLTSKIDWVVYNYFAAAKLQHFIIRFILVIMAPLAIPFGLLLPFWMTHNSDVKIPERFYSDTI